MSDALPISMLRLPRSPLVPDGQELEGHARYEYCCDWDQISPERRSLIRLSAHPKTPTGMIRTKMIQRMFGWSFGERN